MAGVCKPGDASSIADELADAASLGLFAASGVLASFGRDITGQPCGEHVFDHRSVM